VAEKTKTVKLKEGDWKNKESKVKQHMTAKQTFEIRPTSIEHD